MHLLRSLVLLALLLLPACDRNGPHPEVEAEPVKPEPKDAKVPKTKPTRKDRQPPVVSVTMKSIELDGERVGSVAPIVKVGRVAKLDELYEKLRSQWLEQRKKPAAPGRAPPRIVLLTSDDDVPMLAVKSAFQTAATTGFWDPIIQVGVRRHPVSAELSPPSGATLTTPIGPVLSVIVGDRSVRLITREDGVDLATVDEPDGQVAAGVKARFDAKPIDRVVIYVPDDTSFARFGDVLAAVAGVAGNDREPPILLSVLPERPKPEDLDAGIVKGRLPPEVIQRIVRQNFGELRTCYEKGLAKNPKLEGRVVVTFTIERDGTVKTARAGGDLPDPSVRSCVAKQIAELNFPVPDGGVVQVSYPVVFAPR